MEGEEFSEGKEEFRKYLKFRLEEDFESARKALKKSALFFLFPPGMHRLAVLKMNNEMGLNDKDPPRSRDLIEESANAGYG